VEFEGVRLVGEVVPVSKCSPLDWFPGGGSLEIVAIQTYLVKNFVVLIYFFARDLRSLIG